MCQGEALEIMHTWDTSLNCESYQDIISKKTAIFFEKCVRCGGILGNTTEENIEHLGQFAQLMGLVFQMTDDLLDLETTSEILGKTVMQDVREGHYTSAVILALANPEHGPRLKSLLETREDPGNGEKIREILTASNAFAQARERILELVAEAEQELQKVTDVVDETARQALLELLYFVIHRAH
jgi:geranylgeranyl pyrophosphate synthase